MAESSLVYCIPEGKVKPRAVTLVPTDLGSRYKTRQLQIQIQGKSKMIKTVLCNILDVAKDMQIPPTYPGAFFGYTIGAQPHFDSKKPERQQAYLSGEHSTDILSRIMEQFITEVLLCPSCGLPEINITVDKKEAYGKCRACGANSKLNITNTKFKNYLINHPPEAGSATFTANKAVSEKKKKTKKDSDEEAGSDEANGDEEKEETPAELEKKVIEQTEKVLSKTKKERDEVTWYSDTSEEARKKRREAMIPESIVERQLSLKEKNGEVKKLLEPTPDIAKLAELKKSLGISDKEFMSILCTEFLSGATIDEAFITKHKDLFKTFSTNADSQLELLKRIEFRTTQDTNLMNKLPKVIHSLFDLEVVEEDVVKKWNSLATTNAICKQKIAPLIKWFDEAEEEDEEEE